MIMATASTSSPARTHAPPAAAPPAAAAASAAGGFMYASPQFKGIVNASRQQSKSASKIERSVTRSASGGDGSSGSPIPNTEQALRLKQTKPNRSTFLVQLSAVLSPLASSCSITCCSASNHILLATFIEHSGSTSVGCCLDAQWREVIYKKDGLKMQETIASSPWSHKMYW